MIRNDLLVPIIIFSLFAGLYLLISIVTENDFLLKPVWDIDHYRSIAEDGYIVRPCDPTRDYPMGRVCGNVGWFPAWPWAVRFLSLGNVPFGLKFLPFVFTALGMVVFHAVLRRLHGREMAGLGIAALAAGPTAFYFLTGFPYAFLLFLMATYLYFLYRDDAPGRVWLLPGLGVLISLTYPSAFLLAIIPLVMAFNRYRLNTDRHWRILVKDVAYLVLPFALGPLLLSLYFFLRFDDFLLMLHFQEKYDRNWAFPPTVVWESLRDFRWLSTAHFMDTAFTHFAANFVILWYGLILILFLPYRVKPELMAYLALAFLFPPTTGSVLSIWRHYLLLFPAAMIIATSPRPRWFKLTYMALGLLIALVIYFPQFRRGFLI